MCASVWELILCKNLLEYCCSKKQVDVLLVLIGAYHWHTDIWYINHCYFSWFLHLNRFISVFAFFFHPYFVSLHYINHKGYISLSSTVVFFVLFVGFFLLLYFLLLFFLSNITTFTNFHLSYCFPQFSTVQLVNCPEVQKLFKNCMITAENLQWIFKFFFLQITSLENKMFYKIIISIIIIIIIIIIIKS